MQEAGWYYADGDPPETVRYWNGESWMGGPVAQGQQTATVVPDEQMLADPGLRMGGRVIDAIIVGIISWGVMFLLAPDEVSGMFQGFSGAAPDDTASLPVSLTIFTMFFGFVWEVSWLTFAGGTPGKLLLGMEVARANGVTWERVGPKEAALRSLNKLLGALSALGQAAALVGTLASVGIGLASLVMLFSDDYHRTVMDRIGGTIVVKKSAMGQARAGAHQATSV